MKGMWIEEHVKEKVPTELKKSVDGKPSVWVGKLNVWNERVCG
jgi:hypothetical protein